MSHTSLYLCVQVGGSGLSDRVVTGAGGGRHRTGDRESSATSYAFHQKSSPTGHAHIASLILGNSCRCNVIEDGTEQEGLTADLVITVDGIVEQLERNGLGLLFSKR